MGKPVIIVESPAKAKTITKYLENKFVVTASFGHVRDLPKKGLGVDIEHNFKPEYIVEPEKKKVISELKKLTSNAQELYLASDHDREGEAIAWHLADVLKNETSGKPVYRIVFNEITQSAIKKAIANPGTIDINKVDAQQARRILDRIVGYKVSPLLWKLINPSLSAGRVQSVALRLICERDDAIKAFKPEEYWSIEALFSRDKLPPFKAELAQYNGKKIDLKNQKETDAILSEIKDKKSEISGYKQSEKTVQPLPPYITSTLQQDASRLLNFTGKKTMSVAQKLYEGLDIQGETLGLITYMRTDSIRISDEANKALRDFIVSKYGKNKLNPTTRAYKNKNSAQDAHEGIRPTYPWRTPESLEKYLTKDQFRLYDIIWKRFTATQYIPMKLSTVALEITCGKGLFKTSGSVILEKGFTDIYPYTSVDTGTEIHKDYQINDKLKHTDLSGKQHFTKPPAYYTEAQLIKELESKGIGRPSTYASITNTILERKYVEIVEKKFYPTDLGHLVNKFLVKYFDTLFNVTFTADMETKLDNIEYGRQEWQSLLADYYSAIIELISHVDIEKSKKDIHTETDITCNLCGAKMVVKISRGGQFLGCSAYPKCKNVMKMTKDDTGTIVATDTTPVTTGLKCDKCGAEMVIKNSRRGVPFLACSAYPKCKNASDFTTDADGKITPVAPKTVDEKCPQCGSDLVIRKGKFGEFVSCSGYPKCKYIKNTTLGVKCPECHDGDLRQRMSKRGAFYSCSAYPKCKYLTNHKPINTPCPECGNYYLEEHISKKDGVRQVCPKCKKEYF